MKTNRIKIAITQYLNNHSIVFVDAIICVVIGYIWFLR